MAFKLNKAEQKQRDGLVAELEIAGNLFTEIEATNEQIKALLESLNAKIEVYNEAVAAAAEFRDEIVGSRREEWENKSEGWQDGERGQGACAWIDEWESLELDPIEPVEFDPISIDEPEHRDTLENAPDGVE